MPYFSHLILNMLKRQAKKFRKSFQQQKQQQQKTQLRTEATIKNMHDIYMTKAVSQCLQCDPKCHTQARGHLNIKEAGSFKNLRALRV